MGLNLSTVHQRPYTVKDGRSGVKQKQEDERSSILEYEKEQGEESRSKGLQYVENTVDTYEAGQVQTGWQAAKSQIQAQQMMNGSAYAVKRENEPVNTNNFNNNTDINIAQVIKDFRNTAIAIGTPPELQEEVDGYLELIYSQIKKENPNPKLIKSNFKNASTILDGYISQTLEKESKVVENWVDAIFLQRIDFKYDEDNVNPKFLVKFPEKTLASKETEETAETTETTKAEVHEIDPELKSMFMDSKKLAKANKPKEALLNYQKALLKADELGENSIKSKIYFEVGNIYNEYDYIPQALTSYNKSLENATENAVKIKAHYSMAKIYDEVNEISPALDHYYSSAAYAGEENNLEAQTVSLTKMGNIYTDMYEQDAYEFYNEAEYLANESQNNKVIGFVASNKANSYKKFGEPQEALKEYSIAVKHYSQTDSPLQIARSYNSAADLMIEYHNLNKAKSLLQKGITFAEKTDDAGLIAEFREKLEILS
ncbi:hypothetical protein J6S88_01795 [bacterium]|nr:hypothetical protein [bacterium]